MYMRETQASRAFRRKSMSAATARCASDITASEVDDVTMAATTLDVSVSAAGAAGTGGRTDADVAPKPSSSSHKSHVHTAGGGGADAGTGAGRTTAAISCSSASRANVEQSVAVSRRSKSINTESVEHDGERAAGDHEDAVVRGRRDKGAVAAA